MVDKTCLLLQKWYLNVFGIDYESFSGFRRVNMANPIFIFFIYLFYYLFKRILVKFSYSIKIKYFHLFLSQFFLKKI